MSRLRRAAGPTLALALAGLAVLAVPAKAGGAPGAWEADRRLTFGGCHSFTTYNFARNIAAEPDGRVQVVWYSDCSGSFQVYTKRSRDHGATWEAEQLLSTGFDLAEHPAIASSGQTVLVTWHGQQAGTPGLDVFLRRSLDGGRSWGPVEALSASHGAAHSSIALSGKVAQVVWGDNRSGGTEVVTRHSPDGGATWDPEMQISAGRGAASWVPTVEIAGEMVHVAWVDTQDGNEEEYYRRSTDAGRTWEPARRMTRNGANSWAPSLALSGGRVHLAWFDQSDSPVQPRAAEAELDGILRMLGLPSLPEPAGVFVPDPEEEARRRCGEKARQIEAAVPAWVAAGGDPVRLRAILDQVQALGAAGATYLVKERKLDEALHLMGLVYRPHPFPDVPLDYYEDALQLRVADKLQQVSAAAPAWVAHGGDPFLLSSELNAFEQHLDQAFTDWEIYTRRSDDGGQTWKPALRLTHAPGISHRPS
ncbi:MAG TPA: sialidase family protein, partial [Thermoanaerobaculia bacterium]